VARERIVTIGMRTADGLVHTVWAGDILALRAAGS
jgi:hypothetical protein